MKTVLIVDDHPFICLAVRMLLELDGYSVVGEADNGVDAIQQAKVLQPDLVIVDIGIPKLDGLSVIMRLQLLNDTLKVLVLSSQPAGLFSTRCRQAGAAGYVCKSGDLGELSSAIQAIKSGYDYFPSLTASSVSHRDASGSEVERLNSLSDREITVLRLLALGHSNKQIGEDLALSNKTISCYKTRIMEKLRVRTLVDLAEIAKRNSFT
jgi:two-component system response regulator EvgA